MPVQFFLNASQPLDKPKQVVLLAKVAVLEDQSRPRAKAKQLVLVHQLIAFCSQGPILSSPKCVPLTNKVGC